MENNVIYFQERFWLIQLPPQWDESVDGSAGVFLYVYAVRQTYECSVYGSLELNNKCFKTAGKGECRGWKIQVED